MLWKKKTKRKTQKNASHQGRLFLIYLHLHLHFHFSGFANFPQSAAHTYSSRHHSLWCAAVPPQDDCLPGRGSATLHPCCSFTFAGRLHGKYQWRHDVYTDEESTGWKWNITMYFPWWEASLWQILRNISSFPWLDDVPWDGLRLCVKFQLVR